MSRIDEIREHIKGPRNAFEREDVVYLLTLIDDMREALENSCACLSATKCLCPACAVLEKWKGERE